MKAKDVIQAYKVLSNAKLTPQERQGLAVVGDFIPKALDHYAAVNGPYLKLYCYLFGEFCRYYKVTPEDTRAQVELHRLLDRPLELIMEEAMDHINLVKIEQAAEKGRVLKASQEYQLEEFMDNLKAQAAKALLQYR